MMSIRSEFRYTKGPMEMVAGGESRRAALRTAPWIASRKGTRVHSLSSARTGPVRMTPTDISSPDSM
jgi:hypothetical protein